MLTLRLLAARTRLVDVSTTSKCASAIANSLSNNAIQVSSRESLLNPLKSRSLSSVNGPIDQNIEKDDQETMEDETKIQNGQLTSLEQLAQKFQHETDLEDVFEDDWDHTEDHQKKDVYPSKWTSEDTNFARPQHYERRRFDALQSRLARAATNHLRETELDELDFDSELEAVWSPRELKTRKFHQALRREQDRDHVCNNCGERGHRARNCLVPQICSNCGNLGHSASNCRYRNQGSVDELVEEDKRREEKTKQRKVDRKRLLKDIRQANRGGAERPVVPVTDLDKRNQELHAEFLASELDEYADKLERADERRKQKEKK